MGCCSSTPHVPPHPPVVAESAPPRPVAVEVLTPPTPLISEQSPSTLPGGAPPPYQRARGQMHGESRTAPHRSEPIQRAFSSPDQSQPLQSLDGLMAQSQSSQMQRSRSVQALDLDNRTIVTKSGENIVWWGYETFNDCLVRTQKGGGGGAGIDTNGATNTFQASQVCGSVLAPKLRPSHMSVDLGFFW